METKPVKSDVYDENWLATAWGEGANRRLLEEVLTRPRPRVARAVKLARFAPAQRVLDIASGRGEIPVIAGHAGAQAYGLDYSQAALNFARQLQNAQNSTSMIKGGVEFIRADACTLPFANSSFDRVTLLDIIEHLTPAQLDRMFTEVRRVLKPDGYAVLHTLPNRWVYKATFPLVRRIFPRLPQNPRGEIEQKIHINEQDLISLHQTLKKCGLCHHIWLEQHMPAQARWNRDGDRYGDNRDTIYPALAGFWGRLLELLSLTPLSLLLCNDIYGVVWKSGSTPPSVRMPLALTDMLVCALGR